MMDYIELDETLKLLNGFNNNLSKRNEIINYIKENGKMSIFAYGSLLWNPIEHFNNFISNCFLYNYSKGFFCEDFIYRGTNYFTGLTMGLEEDSNGIVNGGLFISNSENIISFIKSFVKRETPNDFNGTLMDIYKYDFVKIILPDKINCEYALTCIVNKQSLFYLNNKLTLEEQANKIGQAYGINGTNFQYLYKLKNIYSRLNINDSFSQHLQNLYEKTVSYRLTLTINSQKWFQIYDQLQSLEERKQILKKQNLLVVLEHFSISLYSQQTQIK
jgi:cation transport regulator ChaC